MVHETTLCILLMTICTGAQIPVPPPSTWIYDGGAIGETATIAVKDNNPGRTYVLASSFAISATHRTPMLLPPFHILSIGTLNSLGVATVKIPVPAEQGLVGLNIYIQGAVDQGSSLWLHSFVCSWPIAPNRQRRFNLVAPVSPFPWPNMYFPSDSHARVTLADGTVLFSGGNVMKPFFPPWRKDAYLYDPVRVTSQRVGDLTRERRGHIARLLHDSTVLVVGGDQDTRNPTAALYDPVKKSFSSLGKVPYALEDPTATVVKNPISGNEYVLIAGGKDLNSNGTATARAMLYDVDNRKFTPLPDMAHQREQAAAVAFPAGAVLITGGRDSQSTAQDSAELFLLATGQFHPWGRMLHPRNGHAMALLDPFRALILSGENNAGARRDMELFDGLLLRSLPLSFQLHFARVNFNPVVLADGAILIAGGATGSLAYPDRVPEILSPTGVTLLRPINEPQPTLFIQGLKNGGVMAYGTTSVHHLQ